MKKNIFSTLIIGFTLLILFGCKTEIEFKSKDIEPKLVLNALVYPDSILTCRLFQTSHAAYGQFSILPISNALIVVLENEQLYDTLRFVNDGLYIGNKTASIENRYKFQATVANFTQVSAFTEVLPNNEVLSVDSVSMRTDQDGMTKVIMRVRMSYNPDITSYYRLKAIAHIEWVDENDSLHTYFQDIDLYNDENLAGIEFYSWKNQALYYTDKIRGDQSAYAEIAIDSYYFNDLNCKNLVFYIDQLSSDLFSYEHSLMLHNEVDDIPIFYQSVQVFNNIEGGVGILGTVKPLVFQISTND